MSILFFVVLLVLLVGVASLIMYLALRQLRLSAEYRRALDVRMLLVTLPKDAKPDVTQEGVGQEVKDKVGIAEQFLSTLSYLPVSRFDQLIYGKPIIVFEIVARNDDVVAFYAGCERRFLDHLEKQIYAHYPDAQVALAPEHTIFEPGDSIRAGWLSLKRPAHLPVATYRELEVDPMQALTGALAKLQRRDAAVIQYVLRPASEKIRRRGRQATQNATRGLQADLTSSAFEKASDSLTKTKDDLDRRAQEYSKLTPRMQQRVELVEQKLSQQLFEVNIRIGVSVRQVEEADRVYAGIVGAFSQYDMPDLNSFRSHASSHMRTFVRDIIFRLPRARTASVLSTTEVASLFHFPLPTTPTPNILWRGSKIAPAPAGLPQDGVMLGSNVYRGIETPIHFAENDRRRHMYLIGQTGTGKTTMFLNMVVQDIKAGRGVGVVDPHGDLIEDILLHIPPEREGDVILFDPRDTERPLGFNMLQVGNEAQKDLVVNEIVTILQKLAARLNPESVGPMFEHYLRNALGALIEDPKATLIDVPRMFVDEKFRNVILSYNQNPTVRQFWEQEFAQSQRGQMSADMLTYVISKLGRFIGNEVVRNLIGQSESSFDVRKVMDEGKILLCNLSKGSLGDINSDLLGFVLVSKLQIAALSRTDMPEEQRRDFYLYLDEFQNFTTDSISTILSEARKYKLSLNLTHQFIQQLDEPIREAVFGNVGTIVSYRVGVEDAEFLARQFSPIFAEYDLISLERFTAIMRLLANGTPQRAFSLAVPAPPSGGDGAVRERVREMSRQAYGTPKERVVAIINERFKVGQASESTQNVGGYMSESLFDIG